MPGYGKQTLDRAVASVGASPSRAGAVHDRHADSLYRQALLTLGDASLAEQVVSHVITEECLGPDLLDGQEYRLAVSVRPAMPGTGHRPCVLEPVGAENLIHVTRPGDIR